MKLARTINLALLVLLGAAAGFAKIVQAPREIAFFQGIGLDTTIVVIFGVIQLLGAALLALRKSRLIGAILLDVMFSLSVVMILLTGQIGFALVSVIPVIMAGFVIYDVRVSGS